MCVLPCMVQPCSAMCDRWWTVGSRWELRRGLFQLTLSYLGVSADPSGVLADSLELESKTFLHSYVPKADDQKMQPSTAWARIQRHEPESIQHMLLSCPALYEPRSRYLGNLKSALELPGQTMSLWKCIMYKWLLKTSFKLSWMLPESHTSQAPLTLT